MTIKHLFPPAWPKLDLNFAAERTLDPRITFTRSSVGTYMDATGILRTAAEDEPRFDHSGTGKSLGLLIEEFRTNELENSDLSDLTEYGCETENSTEVNPEGVASCRRIILDAGLSEEGHRITQRHADFFDETTCSVFVKMDTHPYVLIGAGGQQRGYTAAFNIDPAFTGDRLLGQGGLSTHTNIDAGYESYANGWFRIWASGTTTGQDGWSLSISPDENTFNITDWDAAGTEAIFAHGGQYEYAGFPTSFISTTGAAEDRDPDNCTIEGDNFLDFFNFGDHTTVAEWNRDSLNSRGYLYRYMQNQNQTAEFLEQLDINSNSLVNANTWYGNGSFSGVPSFVGSGKAAFAVTGGDSSMAVNGILQPRRDRAAGSGPTTRMTIGASLRDTYLNGHIARLAYYSRRLSDEQLQALTA